MQEETSLTRPRRRDFMSGTAALAAAFLSGFPFRRHPPPRSSPRSRALAITGLFAMVSTRTPDENVSPVYGVKLPKGYRDG